LSTDFLTIRAPNFIQNTNILITFGKTSVENIGLECTIAYNNIESRFPNHCQNIVKITTLLQREFSQICNP